MLCLARRLQRLHPLCRSPELQLRSFRTDAASSPSRRRPKFNSPPMMKKKGDEKSEWWVVDGEMHEIGENIPPRERFVLPRDNIPNKRRKQLREQFMRRTRLVLKESEHEPWCRKYIELYQELRENWERLYWDEGYSKKLAKDHANYDSAEEDDMDFSPYRRTPSNMDQSKDHGLGMNGHDENWKKVSQIRDRFEYDRERRMREKAFAPMAGQTAEWRDSAPNNQSFDTQRHFVSNKRY